MPRLSTILTLPRRLYLLVALFAIGLAATGALALEGQWEAMRAERVSGLASMTDAVTKAIDKIRTDAAAANISEADAKARALTMVNSLRYGKSGYFSVTSPQGVTIMHPSAAVIGTDFSKTPDANGFYFVADVMPRATREGHASVTYVFPRPGETVPLPKVADYRLYQPWGWFIQTGTYLDDLDVVFWSTARTEFGVAAGILLFLLLTSWIVIRSIVRPLGSMRRSMEQLAGGDTDVTVPSIASNDELGRMASTIAVFQGNMREVVRLRAEQEQTKASTEATHKQMLDGLANNFETKLGALATKLTTASGELEQTARTMSETAQVATARAGVVAVASSQANGGVQTVAAAAEELAASIAEITRQVTESAQMTGETVQEAQRTNGIVQLLAENAQRIGDVVGLISNIAGQTNLLALNATIEAARAGDAGKGFAVVASEVKSLASQTGRATSEISTQISQIQDATRQVVQAIEGIVNRVERANSISSSIAAAVEQQGAATSEIARNVLQTANSTKEVTSTISEVSEATTLTGAAAVDMLAAAGGMSRQAEQVASEVRIFAQSVRAA